MKPAVVLFLLLIPAHLAHAECRVVEHADRNEVVCEDNSAPAVAAPPAPYEARLASGDVVKDGEQFTAIANEVSDLLLDDGDAGAVVARMSNLYPIFDTMRDETAKVAGRDRNLARVYEAQLSDTKQRLAGLIIACGRFLMKKERPEDAKVMLRFLSDHFLEQEFSRQVKQAELWLNELNAR